MEKIERNKDILEKYKRNYPVKKIAEEYGITVSAVSYIAIREIYKEEMKKDWGNLSYRIACILKKGGIKNLSEAKEFKKRIKHIGQKSIEAIMKANIDS